MELTPFESKTEAEAFIRRLELKGFRAGTISVDIAGNLRYRIQIDSFLSLDDAKAYQSQLKSVVNLKGKQTLFRQLAVQTGEKWRLDLIRFSKRYRAEAFVEKLRRKGIDATIMAIKFSGLPLYQVSTMPLKNATEALAYREKLQKKTNLSEKHLQIVSPSQRTAVEAGTAGVLPDLIPSVEEAAVVKSRPPESKMSGSELNGASRTGKATQGTISQTDSSQVVEHSSALLSEWHVYGSNTMRTDIYKSKGNVTSSPYRFSSAHSYDEVNLNLNRSFSPFNRVTAQISGLLYNDSLYRSPYPGSVLERVNVRQENGDFSIPYRAEAGDFFAYQSYRTIQRSLKGGRIEFQPQFGGADFHHSLEFFSGSGTANWDTFQYKDDFSTGGSWLVQHSLAGMLAANLVFNHKQANGFAQPSLQQYVSSLAWEKRGELFGQKLVVEAEAGRFIGDHPAVVAGLPNKQRQGNGYFAQISGTPDALPQLSYRFRGEAYEQDYMPNGASIQSDRNSQEGYLTWRTASGLAFNTRLQHYHTGWQTNNPTDTITYGGNISGMISVMGGISGSVDAFGSNVEDRNLTVNSMAKVVNVNLSKSLNQDLSLRGGFYYANNHDKNNALSGLNIMRQYSVGADMRFDWQGVSGTLSPGTVARRFHLQGVKRWGFNPTFNANLLYGKHQLSLALSRLEQSAQTANAGVDTMTTGVNYRFTEARYTIGLDGNWYDRQPDNAGTTWTNAWHIGAYFTYNFDRPVQQIAMATSETVSDVSPTPSLIERMQVDIAMLTPGMGVEQATSIITDAGLGEATDQAGFLIWYVQIFRDISENQRLAVETGGSRVTRTSIIIDVGAQNDPAAIRGLFERMRRQLFAVYGQPDAFFDQGDFTPNLVTELAAGRFIRVMEWNRDGGTLRFGIPRRLDNQVRMELQFSRSFPALKDTFWSLEELQ